MRNKKIIIFVCIIICLVVAIGLIGCDLGNKKDNNNSQYPGNDFGFDPNNMTKVEVDGFEYGISNDVAMLYKDKTQSEFIKVPKEVTVDGVAYPIKGIADNCFVDNLALKNIYIGNHIRYAGKNLFSDNMERAYLRMYMSMPTGWDRKWKVTQSGFVCEVVLECLDYVIGEEYDYAEFADRIELKKYNGTQTDIIVPSEINDKKVTSFGYIYQNATNLKSVYILDNIEYVDAYAFGNCSPDLKIYCATEHDVYWDFYWDSMTQPDGNNFDFLTKFNVAKYNCTYEDFEYVVYNDNTIELTAYNGDGVNIVIPSTIDDAKVVYFGDIFKELTNLQSVYIPDTITKMRSRCFEGSQNAIIVNQHASMPDSWPAGWEWSMENVFWDCQNVFGEYNGFDYILRNDDTMLIYNYAGTDKDLVIPEKIKDYPVVEFSNEFENQYDFNSVTIPATITKIGKGAIFGYSNIGTLRYKGTLSQWCNIDIEKNYSNNKTIETFAINDEHFVGGVLTIPEDITIIKPNSFRLMQNIQQVILHQNISEIGSNAFEDCSNLIEVQFAEGIKKINSNAFSDCKNLSQITLPEGIEEIGNLAFYYCRNLSQINLPDGIKKIGVAAFDGCRSLIEIKLPNTLEEISSSCFSSTGVKEIIIPENIKTIGANAFWYCRSLEKVSLPSNLNTIEEKAFAYCSILKNIYIPTSVEHMEAEVFYECTDIIINCLADSMPATWDKDWDVKDDNFRHSVLWGDIIEKQNDEYEYIIAGNEVTLTKYIGEASEVVVPETIDGLPVVNITTAYADNSNITSIEVGGHIKTIPENAFAKCGALKKIVLHEGVESIGADFAKTWMQELYLPATVKNIASNSITKISNLYYAGTLEDWCNINFVYWKNGIQNMYIDNTLMQGELIVPQSITQIKPFAFAGWGNIQQVVLHDNITDIGRYAFFDNTLTQINLPDSITSISEYAFAGSNLESVVLPDSITAIGEYAFAGSNLQSVVFSDSITKISNRMLSYCESLTSVVLPQNLQSIGINAFYNCNSLVEISPLPHTLTTINFGAFEYTKIDRIIIPNSVTYIGDYAFRNTYMTIILEKNTDTSGWSKDWDISFDDIRHDVIFDEFQQKSNSEYVYLEQDNGIILIDYLGTESQVTVPEFIDGIPVVDCGNAYMDNDIIVSLYVGGNIKKIKNYAFANCPNLNTLVIGEGVETVGNYILDGTPIDYLELPRSVKKYAHNSFTGLAQLKTFSFAGDIGEWINVINNNSINFSLIFYSDEIYMQSQLLQGELVIPEGITRIPDKMFFGIDNITDIVLPSTLTYIGGSAFQSIDTLQSIIIPDSVTYIGSQAFYNCVNLESVVLPAQLKDIGYLAFAYCKKLTHIELPSGLQTIGLRAFEYSNLVEVVIPDSVTSIGEGAFWGNSNLATIYCEHSSQPENWSVDWNKKDYDNNYYDVQWGYVSSAV